MYSKQCEEENFGVLYQTKWGCPKHCLQLHLQWVLMFPTCTLYCPPSDLECYVQETGRGGRDGCTTNAVLYYDKKDLFNTNEAMRSCCVN